MWLIRDTDERAVQIICDNQIVMRPYGEVFLNGLPPTPRARDIAQTIVFLKDTPLLVT